MYKLLLDFFGKYRFKSQIFFTFLKYFLLQLVFFAVIVAVSTVYIIRSERIKADNEVKIQVQRIEDMTNVVFKQIDRIAATITIDNNVKTYVYMSENSYVPSREKPIAEKLVYYKNIVNYIDSIYLYSGNNNRVVSTNGQNGYAKYLYDFEEKHFVEWLNDSMTGDTLTTPRQLTASGRRVITLVKKMNEGGYVIVNIGYEKFLNLVKFAFQYDTRIFLLDSNNRIVFDGNGTTTEQKALEVITTKETNDVKLENSSYTKIEIGYYKQPLLIKCDLTPFYKYRKYIFINSIFIFVFFIIISILIAVFFAFSSFKTIATIYDVLKSRKYDLSKLKDNEEKDIIKEIIKLIDDNSGFKHQLDIRLKEYNDAQVIALQKQINPHFLNNTLSAISYKIVENEGVEAPALGMIVTLSRIIRYGFNSDVLLVPLAKELDFIKDYVKIAKTAYGDFDFTVDVDESILKCRVLRLSLQPLVENCVCHGIKKLEERGKIKIKCKLENNRLCISVEDNGVGMSQEMVEQINNYNYDTDKADHMGINNVIQRMKMIYPDNFTLKCESSKETGTKFIMSALVEM